MGSISVACYKPRPGCEQALAALVREHLPPLRAQGLVTARESIVMRTADGTIVEVFEWVSQGSDRRRAHEPCRPGLVEALRGGVLVRDALEHRRIPEPVRAFRGAVIRCIEATGGRCACAAKADSRSRFDRIAPNFSTVTPMHAVSGRGFVFTSITGLVRPEARCG